MIMIIAAVADSDCSMYLSFSIKKMIESGIRDKIWGKYKLVNKMVCCHVELYLDCCMHCISLNHLSIFRIVMWRVKL